MEKIARKVLFTAVMAGVAAGISAQSHADEGAQYVCQDANLCKAQGACSGGGHSCSGMNGCMGKGWVYTRDKASCDAQQAKVKAALKRRGKPAAKSQARA